MSARVCSVTLSEYDVALLRRLHRRLKGDGEVVNFELDALGLVIDAWDAHDAALEKSKDEDVA